MDKLTIKTSNIALKFNTGSIVVTGGNVESVNGKTGPSIVLDATDVGAEPAGSVQQAKDEIQPQINELNNEVDLIQPQLVNLSENKLDKVDYVQHFLGVFPSKAALDAAHATARPGDSADIDSGSGFDVMRAIWDGSDHKWVVREVNNAQNTDQVPEGNTNLYFKSERVLATILSGFNPVNAAITATDTIIQAISKVQGQINNIANVIRATTLTGVDTTLTSTLIDATDTVLSGMGKLQGQIRNTQNTVRNTILTGFTASPNQMVSSSDTVLQALGKLQAQANASGPAQWVDLTLVGTIPTYVATIDVQLARWGGLLWIRGSFTVNTTVNQYSPLFTLTSQQFKAWSNRSSGTNPRQMANIVMWLESGQTRTLSFSSAKVVNNTDAGTVTQEFAMSSTSAISAADGIIFIPPTPLGKLVN